MQRKSGGGEVERTGNGAVKVRTKTEQLGEVISLVHSLLIRAHGTLRDPQLSLSIFQP